MDKWREFFEINRIPVLFFYGQAFFDLGLAIALHSRRHSRLELARSLGWLAAFGFTHGLHEWGQIFIPLQAQYLDTAMVHFLILVQVILLALSFGFLLQFGVELLAERWPRLTWLPITVMLIWGLWFIMPGLALTSGFDLWRQNASIWARYLIGFPGALLAALALRYQAERNIKPLGLVNIYRTLQLAGLALLAYSVLGGLIVPEGDFFPANQLNEVRLVAWLGAPAPVFRALTGMVLVLAMIRTLEVFDFEVDRLIEQMEDEQSLMAERQRIGRELHDGVLQEVYSAGLLMEAAHGKLNEEPIIAAQRLEQAIKALHEAIAGLRAYMGELRPGPSALSLVEGVRRQTSDPRLTALMTIDLIWQIPETTTFSPSRTGHILAIVSEALANVARHAQAHRVHVRFSQNSGHLLVSIEDDGRGFSGQPDQGHGLLNMRERARLLGGELALISQPGQGTKVNLQVPVEERAWT